MLEVFDTSVVTARDFRPRARISPAADCTSISRRPVGATSAPARARARASIRPIPEVPPMTTAVRPLRSNTRQPAEGLKVTAEESCDVAADFSAGYGSAVFFQQRVPRRQNRRQG